MRFDFIRRGATLAAGMALAVSSVAVAAIPDQGPRPKFWACYDASGQVRLVDNATTTCPEGTTSTWWYQSGETGPQGLKGEKGDAGPAGPTGPAGPAARDIGQHWVITRADDVNEAKGKSDADTQVYYGSTGRRWIYFPAGVDVAKCSVQVTAEDPNGWSGTPITTTYMKYYGWLIVEANKVGANGAITPVNTAMDVIVGC
jgi:hypothetical protein